MRRWSLRRRLMMRLAILITGFWVSTAMVAAYFVYEEISEVLDSSLEETAQRIAPLTRSLRLQQTLSDKDDNDHDIEKYEHEEYVSYQIQESNGRLIFRSHEAPKTAWPIKAGNGLSISDGWRLYTVYVKDSPYIVQVGEKLEHRFVAVSEATLALLAPILVVLPIMLFLFRHILNRSFVPVTTFSREIEDRSSTNLSDVASIDLPTEFDPIRNRLNELLARVRTTLVAERAFSSNSAHQLRTPVAAALAQSQMLERELDTSPQRERVRKVSEALRRLSRIVEKLLQLARADTNDAQEHDRVNVPEIISFVIADFRRLTPEQPFRLMGLDKPYFLIGDADVLSIISQNLIENAVHYATPQTTIDIELTDDNCLIVRNDCDPIDPALLSQLGNRFVRGSHDARGSGLGLAIVHALARRSGLPFSISSPVPGQGRGFEAKLDLNSTKPTITH